jgi:HK97 family phage portal protein
VSVWSNIIRWFSGGYTRQRGAQSGDPQSGGMVSVAVTAETAMQLSAVWACVRLIAETVAALPVAFFEVDAEGNWAAKDDHPLALLFAGKPNRYQTRVEFFETLTMQLALYGNCYCLIGRAGKRVVSLMPLMASQMQEVTLLDNGDVSYAYSDGGKLKVFAEANIWHVKLMGNGIIGLSPLGHARNAIGLGIANERAVAKLANRGFKQHAVLMIDKLLKPEQRQQIREQFSDIPNSDDYSLRVLEAGMTYQPISINPKDMQLLESRHFQIEDICRFFGVPSVLVNDAGATTTLGSGISQIVQGFYKLTLRPYLERFEASIKNHLVDVAERRTIEAEFDFSALLRGDDAERFKTYKEAVQGGIKTPNECRALEGDVAMPGGDDLVMQIQMVPLKLITSMKQIAVKQDANPQESAT